MNYQLLLVIIIVNGIYLMVSYSSPYHCTIGQYLLGIKLYSEKDRLSFSDLLVRSWMPVLSMIALPLLWVNNNNVILFYEKWTKTRMVKVGES